MKQTLHLLHSSTAFLNRVRFPKYTSVMWLLVIVFGFGQLNVRAQQVPQKGIYGVVIDSQDLPITGATVTIQGTVIRTATDINGKFAFSPSVYKPRTTDVIQVFCTGMIPMEQRVANRTYFHFKMKSDVLEREEMVVTGFQTIRKTNFTGSASKVNTEELHIKGSSDISRMLEGAIAGVSIQNVSGTFGTAPKIRVRGVSSINGENRPLWVIDGVIHENIINLSNEELTSGNPSTLLGSAVAGLNANDIESINVLKDASATALYGARAMNGVMIVTTKRGKTGRPIVSYSGNFSIQLKPSYGDYDIMNSRNQMSVYAGLEKMGWFGEDIMDSPSTGPYGNMYRLINTIDKTTGNFALENTPAARNNYLMRFANANTDWFDTLFRTSLQQEHSVSISAGGKKSSTYGSLSLLNDGGQTLADHVTRYTGNLRNDYQVSKRVNIGLQIMGSVRRQKAPGTLPRSNNAYDENNREFDINPYSYALNASRALTAYDQQGELEYFTRNYAPFNIINEWKSNSMKSNVIDFKAQAEVGVVVAKGLKYEFMGAARYASSNRTHLVEEQSNMAGAYRADETATIRRNNKYLYRDPEDPNIEPFSLVPFGGFHNKTKNTFANYDIRNNFKYNHDFNGGRHTINALVGQQIRFTERQQVSNTGFESAHAWPGNLAGYFPALKERMETHFPQNEIGKTQDRFYSFYANVDYSFDNRYVVAATIRYDNSHTKLKGFDQEVKSSWLPTWTISGKWNIDNEQFIQQAKWIDELSIRASYGLSANMPQTVSTPPLSIFTSPNLLNNELSWEKSRQTNIGLDLGLFNHRLNFVFDYWRKNSSDLICPIKVAGIGGSLWKYANYADMKSNGFDLTIAGYPVRNKNFSWQSSFTFGYNKTEITNIKSSFSTLRMCSPDGGNLEGYPVRSLFSLQYVSTDKDGVPSFIDENGEIASDIYLQNSASDYLKYEGPVDPKYTGGWANTFRYKSLSLNILLTYQGGNKIRMAPAFKSTYTDMDAMPMEFFERWVTNGDKQYTTVPAIVDKILLLESSPSSPFTAYNYSDARVADGGFLRLKNISLTYTLPKRWMQQSGFISNATITCAASNMWLIFADKRLNGQDPEFYNAGGVAQPLAKQVTIAINVSF